MAGLTVDKIVTSHNGCFVLGLLQILLGQLQIEVDLNLFPLQFSKLGPELTRFLQPMDKAHQSTETKTDGF